MEPLLKQLRELPRLLGQLPAGLKVVLFLGAVAVIGVTAFSVISSAETYQYAFTNLTPEDSSEAAATLKASGVPFRVEAGGSAVAVPSSKVYDVRLLLAAAGLPRGGGVGFEIFDRGDLGVSEFTQKINLRRATEGELARTISRLSQVRSARVHLTLGEKGLYRDQDHAPSAAVVVNLQPGRNLSDREIAGIRHLVSSAVPGLDSQGVTLVNGRGEILSPEGAWGESMSYQRRFEHDLEQRVQDLLGEAVGAGSVVARVTATLDQSEVSTQAESVDPDASAVRSERTVSSQNTGSSTAAGGVAGAAANQPLAPASSTTQGGRNASATSEEAVRNYDVSRTTTTTVAKLPRLQRISLAVLVDGVNGQPRPAPEMQKLGDLAKRAVGFDEARGDTFEISSSPFVHSDEAGAETKPEPPSPWKDILKWGGVGLGVLAVLGLLAFALRGGRRGADGFSIAPGSRVGEIEAAMAQGALPPAARPALADPAAASRERARGSAGKDPGRAASILKAWMSQEGAAQRSNPHG